MTVDLHGENLSRIIAKVKKAEIEEEHPVVYALLSIARSLRSMEQIKPVGYLNDESVRRRIADLDR